MTFSIVARDRATGAFGVATATGGPVVGVMVPHARSGVGAIATQSMTNPLYGIDGLDLLGAGTTATEVLEALTAADPDRDVRQCIMIGVDGPPAAFTGAKATPFAGHVTHEDFAVAGNMLANDDVIPAVVSGFIAAGDTPLADRLLAALESGEAAGGDRRGTRSAAIKVFADQPYPFVDIRVDWSTTPVAGLAEVLAATQADGYASFYKKLPRRQPR